MASLTNQQSAVSANDIHDIRAPLDIFNPWILAWIALGILVVAAIVFAIIKYLQKRRQQSATVRVVPAHVRARQKLEESLSIISQPKPFCTLVSDTIRFYLEERFDFHAPDRTTEEFLHELRSTSLLTTDQKNSLGDFLQSCDLVKFAQYEPTEVELRELHSSALRLIDETEPVTSSAEPARPSRAPEISAKS